MKLSVYNYNGFGKNQWTTVWRREEEEEKKDFKEKTKDFLKKTAKSK